MKEYKIFTINPGSTSTKVALFEGEKALLSTNIKHSAEELAQFAGVSDQREYRMNMILAEIEKAGLSLDGIDAVVGRGGGLIATEGGTYAIDEVLLDHAVRGANGVTHPAQLGPQLAKSVSEKYNVPAFVVNPPDTDELIYEARVTGVKGVYRNVHLHALNLKETAIRHSAAQGCKYEDKNYVVCHLGGGVSVSAHRKGKMIDGNDIVGGEGPMTPTRCGDLPVTEVIKLCDKEGLKGAKALAQKSGGFVSHFGTADAQEVNAMIEAGNETAKIVWDTFVYQIIKYIGSMAAALDGKVDAILIGGGIAHNKQLIAELTERCSWIAPVFAYPGEFEMEAMAAGATRVLNGEEEAKKYSGVKNWKELEY
ncbi:MAG: butyrate kinase [Oscillospiraceae bacterium]|nr:butyrate kinase [Oscillospiraceae bacterium]